MMMALSPAQRAGLIVYKRKAPSDGDRFRFRCGDAVREKDGRHRGIVVAMAETTIVVRWEETGWKSVLSVSDVEAYS